MTLYLTIEQALRIARHAIGIEPEVRDLGLLESALRRPATTVRGENAYPELLDKAGAMLHSLARNHSLVDGNKRLAWLATWVFCAKNGLALDPDDDRAYELVIAVAGGDIDEVEEISAALASLSSEGA